MNPDSTFGWAKFFFYNSDAIKLSPDEQYLYALILGAHLFKLNTSDGSIVNSLIHFPNDFNDFDISDTYLLIAG